MKNVLKVTAAGDRVIEMTRVFDAPRATVFDAWTKPEILKRWLGVRDGWIFETCEMDLRPGGRYRWVWLGPDGMRMGMGGVYKEVVVPERVVATEKFDESWYPGEAVWTILFTEEGGRTTYTQRIEYASREAREMVLKSPMETGVAAGCDQLDLVLASLSKA